jgi:hypothetical protein
MKTAGNLLIVVVAAAVGAGLAWLLNGDMALAAGYGALGAALAILLRGW